MICKAESSFQKSEPDIFVTINSSADMIYIYDNTSESCEGRDCGAVLNPFCYVDFHSKSHKPSFCVTRQRPRLDVPILPHAQSFSSEGASESLRKGHLNEVSGSQSLRT